MIRKCIACQKWYFGDVRYCPRCRTDVWSEQAGQMAVSDLPRLLEYAQKLEIDGREEKAGVMAAVLMEELTRRGSDAPFYLLLEGTKMLADMYTSKHGDIPDELMLEALDLLEERTEERENPEYRQEIEEMRDELSKWIPEVKERRTVLAYCQDFWKLPTPEEVLRGDSNDFEADLTKTKGMSLTEICYLFFGRYRQALDVLSHLERETSFKDPEENPEENEETEQKNRFMSAVFSGVAMNWKDAGPVADAFYLLMRGLNQEARAAIAAMYSKPVEVSLLESVRKMAIQTAQAVGLFPDYLFFLALICPLLCREGDETVVVYEMMEPDMRALLRLIEEVQKKLRRERDEEERGYLMQLIQTLSTEYSNVFAVEEYQRAKDVRLKGPVYRELLESAAGNGLALACVEAARAWFYGEHGFEVHMEYAKYYTMILKLRTLKFAIVNTVDQVENLAVKVPGVEE